MAGIEQGGGYRPRPFQEKFDAGSQGGNTSGGENLSQGPSVFGEGQPSGQLSHRGYLNKLESHPPQDGSKASQPESYQSTHDQFDVWLTEEAGGATAFSYLEEVWSCPKLGFIYFPSVPDEATQYFDYTPEKHLNLPIDPKDFKRRFIVRRGYRKSVAKSAQYTVARWLESHPSSQAAQAIIDAGLSSPLGQHITLVREILRNKANRRWFFDTYFKKMGIERGLIITDDMGTRFEKFTQDAIRQSGDAASEEAEERSR